MQLQEANEVDYCPTMMSMSEDRGSAAAVGEHEQTNKAQAAILNMQYENIEIGRRIDHWCRGESNEQKCNCNISLDAML